MNTTILATASSAQQPDLLTTDLYKTRATTTLQRRFKAVLKQMVETVASELPSPYEEGTRDRGFWYY